MRCFLLYVDDWLASQHIRQMDAHEELAYFHLILCAATEEDCGLPDNDPQLAMLSGLGPQWFKPTKEKTRRIEGMTSGEKIRMSFFQKDGRIFNARLLREWEHQRRVAESRREAGILGGRPKKHLQSNSLSNGNQTANQTESKPKQTQTQTQTQTENIPKHNGGVAAFDEWFAVFWKQFWRIGNKALGKKALAKHATSDEARARILAAMLSQKPGYERRDTEKRPYLSTWANQERFNDEPELFENGSGHKETREEERERYFRLLAEDHVDENKQDRLG